MSLSKFVLVMIVKWVAFACFMVFGVMFGTKLALHHMVAETKQRWDSATELYQLRGKQSGDAVLDALVARHMAGDTSATQVLMNKAMLDGQLFKRGSLLWEAVERASDPQLYDLLAQYKGIFQADRDLDLIEPGSKKAFVTVLNAIKAKVDPKLSEPMRKSLEACYERFDARYTGVLGGFVRAVDDYRNKRSCEIHF
jgi:hypothetical protein